MVTKATERRRRPCSGPVCGFLKLNGSTGGGTKKVPLPSTSPPGIRVSGRSSTPTNKKQHTFSIAPSLHLFIDRREIEGHIVKIDQNELLLLDKYGYHVKVTAGLNGPTTVYDEADDVTYKLEAVSSR